jgi:hypothetical protein
VDASRSIAYERCVETSSRKESKVKTLIPIAAALVLAACNPTNDYEREEIGTEPVPMDQDPVDGDLEQDGLNTQPEEVRAVTDQDKSPGLETDTPAFEQSQDPEDIRITAEIRRAVIDAEGMSALADNVQIVTREGVVSLVGSVETAEEKAELERIARSVAGVGQVQNQLVVNQQD